MRATGESKGNISLTLSTKINNMKKIMFIPIIMFHLFVMGQDKGVTKIIIDSVTFTDAAARLLDAGYFLDKADSALGMIVTLPRITPKHGNFEHQIFVRVKDGKAMVTGKMETEMFGGVSWDIGNRGMKGSPGRDGFNALNQYALSFNRKIEYSK